jgi:hypothetical protein
MRDRGRLSLARGVAVETENAVTVNAATRIIRVGRAFAIAGKPQGTPRRTHFCQRIATIVR